MLARRLIARAAFGPEALNAIFKAFDQAWKEIKPGVGRNPLAIEAAQLSLANIVLSLAKEDSRDPEPLRTEAVRLLLLKRQISN